MIVKNIVNVVIFQLNLAVNQTMYKLKIWLHFYGVSKVFISL